MTHLHYFEHHMIFTSKSETFTFALLLVPAGRYNFRKFFGRFRIKFKNIDFGPKNASFTPFRAEYKFSLKIQNSLFKSILNAFHQEQFQKNLMNWFRKSSNCWFWVQKWCICPISGMRIFRKKEGFITTWFHA